MTPKKDWEQFFDGHAPIYMENCFTRNTLREVEFLLEELGLPSGAAILDIGCGAGRHSIELARRGFAMTGVDISSGMLVEARKLAAAARVDLCLLQADAAAMNFKSQFDGVICLCEGAFGLLGQGDDAIQQPLAILKGAAEALKPGAKCFFTVLNGFAMARRHSQTDVDEGRFDPVSLSEFSDCSTKDGPFHLQERGFVPTELVLLFQTAGLKVLHLWGGTAGNWRRGQLDLDEMEVMVIAEKEAENR